MEANIVTHLTAHSVSEALQNPGKRMKVVVQVLDVTERDLKGKPMTCVRLSDGHFCDSFIIYPQIVDEFRGLVAPLDIIEAGIIVKDSSRSVKLMYEYKPVYGAVGEVVGTPVEAPVDIEDAANPRGSNEIPQRVLFSLGDEPAPPRPPARQTGMQVEVDDGRGGRRAVVGAPVAPVQRAQQDNELYTEIANLNAYDRSWKIKGRVIKKSDLREFVSKGKDGCVFNVVILDATRSIQGVFFNEVARAHFDRLQVGKVYSFADGQVKSAGNFNATDNKLEISFGDKSEIAERPDDAAIPGFHFNLVKISELGARRENDVVDVLAVVQESLPLREITLKSSGELKEVREVVFKDDTAHTVSLTLWGSDAVAHDLAKDSIVVLQNVVVKEYNGRTLGFTRGSRILDKVPEMARYRELLVWRNSARGGDDALVSLAGERVLHKLKLFKVAQVNEAAAALMEEHDDVKLYFSVIVSFVRLLGNVYYDACEDPKCLKKVVRNTFGTFDCDKCNKTFDRPKARLFASLKFADDSDSFVASVAGEEHAKLFFERSAEELKALKCASENDFADFVRGRQFDEFKLRVSAKKEFFMSEAKVKFTVIKATRLDKTPEFYCTQLLDVLHDRD